MRFASKDGTSIACTRDGSGPPLVLVHGTTADHTRWAPVIPALAERFTVYACDRRGRGDSTDAAAYAIEREAEDVAAVVDGIGAPVALLGHSYGAIASLEAMRLTHGVDRLVLYEPPIGFGMPSAVIESLEATLATGDRERLVIEFLKAGPRMPDDQLAALRALPAWERRVAAAPTIPRELRSALAYRFDPAAFSSVRTPTLLLLGGASPTAFHEATEVVHRALCNSRVVVLPGEQHVAMDTAPSVFVREVLAFLSS